MAKSRLGRCVRHEFVGDTGDGGVAVVIRGLEGEDMARAYVDASTGEKNEDLNEYVGQP